MADNNNTGSLRGSSTGAHVAPGSTGRFTARNTAATVVTSITGVLKATTASGRHEAVITAKPEPKRMDPDKKKIIYRAIVVAAAILVILFACSYRTSSKAGKYADYIASAEQSFYEGDFDTALAYLRRAGSVKTEDSAVLLMAECYYNQGNYERALEVLRTLNTSDNQVKKRIAEIEEKKDQIKNADIVRVGSLQYAVGSPDVNLSQQHLGNNVIEQVKQFRYVSSLNLSGNDMTGLTGIGDLAGLSMLDLSDNSISSVDELAALQNLRVLILDNNPVADLSPLYGLSNLTSLSIRGIEMSQEKLVELSAALPSCAIRSESANSDALELTIGGISFKSDATELRLNGLSLTDISVLSQCRNLVNLDLSNNHIVDITPLMDLPNLQKLNLSSNQISDIRALIAMTSLKSIDVSYNEISTTNAFSAMNAVEELILDGNPVADFSGIGKMYSLKALSVKNTGLKETDFQYIRNLGNLRTLNMEDNPQISGEAFDQFNLAMLNCRITHSPMVYSIQFCGESYKENITELNASGKEIETIDDLTRFRYLKSIDLSDNKITNIYLFAYNCKDVTRLDLSGNEITDISPLSNLRALEYLDLSDNRIEHINSLMGMNTLTVLNLQGNNVSEENLAKLRSALPLCEIIY